MFPDDVLIGGSAVGDTVLQLLKLEHVLVGHRL